MSTSLAILITVTSLLGSRYCFITEHLCYQLRIFYSKAIINFLKEVDEYFDGIQSTEGKSVLQIKGGLNSTGTYGCRNHLFKIYRKFTVTLNDGKLSNTEAVAVIVSVAVFFLLIIFIVVGFISYKRRITNVTSSSNTSHHS